jgi:hypothetical protein
VLTDVDVVARTAGSVSGRIDDAELTTDDARPAVADVTIEGSGRAATATVTVGARVVDRAVRDTFQRQFAVPVTAVALEAPDILRVSAAGTTVEGRLEIDAAGAIVIRTVLGAATILSLDSSFPLDIEAVGVVGGDLRIDGTLDVDALLGG